MNNKRGQEVIGISFGVILSIIIVIGVVAVAIYAISHFIGLKKCTDSGFFYRDLQDEIDRAWAAGTGRYRNILRVASPSGITQFCFGNLSASSPTFALQQAELKKLAQYDLEKNAFLYPPNEACDGELFSYKLEHTEMGNSFFCVKKDDAGKINIAIRKEPTDRVVKVSDRL